MTLTPGTDEVDLLATVSDLASEVLREFDLDRILHTVTDAATRLSGAQFGAFFYNAVAEGGEAHSLFVLAGEPRAAFAAFPVPRDSETVGPNFDGLEAVRLDDATLDAHFGSNAPDFGLPPGHLPVRSYLAAPVIGRSGAVLGGLSFGHADAGMFTKRHERLVVVIAAQAAVAIENARLFAAEQQARAAAEDGAAQLERLQAITSKLSQASSLGEVADVVVSTAAAGVGADGAMIATVSPDRRHLHVLSALGYDWQVVRQFADMSLDDVVPATEAVRTGRIVAWRSLADRDARFPSLAGLPGSADRTAMNR